MKILHIISGDLWAGKEKSTFEFLKYLKAQNTNINAITFNAGKFSNKLQSLEITNEIIPENKFNFIQIFFRSFKFIKNNNIDIIHTHDIKENFLGGLLSKIFKDIKHVTTIHGNPEPFSGFKGIKSKIYNFINKIILKHIADIIVCVSKDVRRNLKNIGIAEDKLRLLYNALDLSGDYKQKSNFNNNLVFGAVGRLVPIKGYQYLIDAIDIIKKKQNIIVKTYIYGEGPLEDYLSKKIIELDLSDTIQLVGFQDDLGQIYSSFDVFIMPSINEGIPLALLEAMANSKIIIASRTGGIIEVIKNMENGFLFEVGDCNQLADIIIKVIDNYEKYMSLGIKAKSDLHFLFDVNIIGKSLENIYKECCNS